MSITDDSAVVGGRPQIKFCLGPPKGLGRHCLQHIDNWIENYVISHFLLSFLIWSFFKMDQQLKTNICINSVIQAPWEPDFLHMWSDLITYLSQLKHLLY